MNNPRRMLRRGLPFVPTAVESPESWTKCSMF